MIVLMIKKYTIFVVLYSKEWWERGDVKLVSDHFYLRFHTFVSGET